MLTIIRQNKYYFSCLGLYFILVGILLLTQEKGTAVLFLNSNHNFLLDFLFTQITFLGDGWFAFPFIALVLLFRNIYQAILLLSSVLGSFVFVQTIKLYIFPDMPRPSKYFPETIQLHYVENMDIHSYHSFPSGHSAQAFAIFLLLALFTSNKKWAVVYFILAVLVTVSRMYLAQHFLMDTYFGALIATIVSFITYNYFENHTSLSSNVRLQKGLIR